MDNFEKGKDELTDLQGDRYEVTVKLVTKLTTDWLNIIEI